MQCKYFKMCLEEISSMAIMFFRFLLCALTNNLSDYHEKYPVLSTDDINVEYQILNLCYNLFFSYADKMYTQINA